MFVFKTKVILNELEKYAPKVLNQCTKALNNSVNDLDFTRIDKQAFAETPNIPIDIAVMEKPQRV